MVNKKGYFYVIELLLVVLIVIIFVLSMPESERKHTSYEEEENLRAQGYGSLYALDVQGIFDKYIEVNFTYSNFTRLKEHIVNSVHNSEVAKIEYIYGSEKTNYTQALCLNSTGDHTECGKVPKRTRELLVSTIYTHYKKADPVTIKLYLRRYAI